MSARKLDNHYLPVSQIVSGAASPGMNPGDLATLLEWQVGEAVAADQKVTITMSLSGATALVRLLRKAHKAGF